MSFANIASGTAATSLSQMLGREVDINVPKALALPLADAVDAVGDAAESVTGVALELEGSVAGIVLLLIPADGADTLCNLLGVEPGARWPTPPSGRSATSSGPPTSTRSAR